jgi:hypothetical protein
MAKFVTGDLLREAQKITNTWTANPTFSLGATTLADFQAALTALQQADATVEMKRTELKGLIDARDDKAAALTDLVTRARSGFRAVYGADSAQYEQAGGTRKSERKRPTRRAKAD